MAPQTIQIKRRIPGTGAPPSGTGANQVRIGELATSISALGSTGIANLYIGDGTYVHDLVSSNRQLELAGMQNITGDKTITTGSLTTPLANFHIQGGTNGYLLSTNGTGTMSWIAPPSATIVGPTQPPGPNVAGDMWFDSTNNILHVHNGTTWIASEVDTDDFLLRTGGTMTGLITFAAGQTIAGYLPLTGGTLSGNLTFSSTNANIFATNGFGFVAVAGGVLLNAVAGSVDIDAFGNIELTSGDVITLTGGPNRNINLLTNGTGRVRLSADPVAPLDAATRQYVDAAAAAGFTGVTVNAPITGTGMPASALGITPATTAQATAGTDNVYPLTSLRLREKMGLDVASLATTAKQIVPAINELDGDISTLSTQIQALSGALRFVGNFSAAVNQVTSAATGTLTVGQNLPAAATTNEGWYVIVTAEGTSIAPVVPTGTTLHVGDWIVSTGSQWIHVPLYHVAATATNVGITTINAQTWTNVQQALDGLYTLATADPLDSIHVDGTSIVGDGDSTTPFSVGLVDGGTY